MNKCSFKAILRTNAMSKKTKLCPLSIQVIINGKVKVTSLGILLLIDQWDAEKQKVINHPQAHDINLIIESDRAKATEIFTEYRLLRKFLSIDDFSEQFYNYANRKDFIEFMQKDIEKRFNRMEITLGTKKNQLATLKKLRKFRKEINFYELNEDLIRDFDLWHGRYLKEICNERGRSQKHNSHNTRAKALSHIKCYINRAIKKSSIKITNPFDDIVIKERYTDVVYLDNHEIQKLHQHFISAQDEDKTYMISLAIFMFSLCTGLRISDAQSLHQLNIVSDKIVFKPKKSIRYNKTITIPLTKAAKFYFQYLSQFIPLNITDVTVNRLIKRASRICHIKKHLTTHVARHTFATQFVASGGNIIVLQELLGHSDIRTTMKYVHLVQNQKLEQMMILDNYLGLA